VQINLGEPHLQVLKAASQYPPQQIQEGVGRLRMRS
jgi:hypothetical protein